MYESFVYQSSQETINTLKNVRIKFSSMEIVLKSFSSFGLTFTTEGIFIHRVAKIYVYYIALSYISKMLFIFMIEQVL